MPVGSLELKEKNEMESIGLEMKKSEPKQSPKKRKIASIGWSQPNRGITTIIFMCQSHFQGHNAPLSKCEGAIVEGSILEFWILSRVS